MNCVFLKKANSPIKKKKIQNMFELKKRKKESELRQCKQNNFLQKYWLFQGGFWSEIKNFQPFFWSDSSV